MAKLVVSKMKFTPRDRQINTDTSKCLMVLPPWVAADSLLDFRFKPIAANLGATSGRFYAHSVDLESLHADLGWVEEVILMDVPFSQICEKLDRLLCKVTRRTKSIILKNITF